MSKRAFITGITGQDGAYLAELLLKKDYEVYGLHRRTSTDNFWRIQTLGIEKHPNLHLIEHDLTDIASNIHLIKKHKPQEIYNLAAQSFVGTSFEQPIATAEITGLGPLNFLEAIRMLDPSIRFYQASTSEMFGKVQAIPQTEDTPFYPRSPYGIAKLYAHWMTINYRESYGLHASSGILFNHESPLRGLQFVTRKITDGIAKIKAGQLDCLQLGNLDAKRDWGFAKDYVDAMYRMVQLDTPEDFVIATNVTTTIRDFINMAIEAADMNVAWEGEGQNERAIDTKTNKTIVSINPKFYRPAEVDLLIGDPSKAKKLLNWEPDVDVKTLCTMMMQADLKRICGIAPGVPSLAMA